ncbi:MAG: MetQ/NlpA family ABC transporter substrate-binding protein, partial [Planctomycetes bacterium]|nr:MetQ/NlpA family ABC transporter substrate-binding protein [Planctomycetota bacterium]
MRKSRRHRLFEAYLLSLLLLLAVTGLVFFRQLPENVILPTFAAYDSPDLPGHALRANGRGPLEFISESVQANASPRLHLRVGVVPGFYGVLFMETIFPFLRELGYTAELVYLDDYTLPNRYLAEGMLDLNIFQHYRYLVTCKFEHNLRLSAVAEIPTAMMGLYSARHDSLDDLPNGLAISLPDDPTNMARALILLEEAGLLRLRQDIDKGRAEPGDIVGNPRGVQLAPAPAHTLVSTLAYHDLAVINGNFAESGGLRLQDALFTEWLRSEYFNIIAVRTEDLGERFVKDIIDILRTGA